MSVYQNKKTTVGVCAKWDIMIYLKHGKKLWVESMTQRDINQPTFEDLELLAEVSQLLTVVDLNSVLQRVIQLAARAVGASKTSLFLHDDKHIDWAHIITMRNLSLDKSVKVVTRVMDAGFAGWVYRHQRGDII